MRSGWNLPERRERERERVGKTAAGRRERAALLKRLIPLASLTEPDAGRRPSLRLPFPENACERGSPRVPSRYRRIETLEP